MKMILNFVHLQEALSYSITALREATTYVAEVCAFSKAGEGASVTMAFSTPILQLKPLGNYFELFESHFILY